MLLLTYSMIGSLFRCTVQLLLAFHVGQPFDSRMRPENTFFFTFIGPVKVGPASSRKASKEWRGK
jgi:hypothetical protein